MLLERAFNERDVLLGIVGEREVADQAVEGDGGGFFFEVFDCIPDLGEEFAAGSATSAGGADGWRAAGGGEGGIVGSFVVAWFGR